MNQKSVRHMVALLATLLFVLLGATAVVASNALTPDGDPFPIGPLVGEKGSGVVAVNANGQAVVAWTQGLLAPVYPDTSDVYAQRLDSAGGPIGGPIKLNTALDKGEQINGVAIGEAGQFVAVWYVYFEARGRCYDASGAPLGEEFALDGTGRGEQDAAVAMGPDGSFVAVWSEQYYDGDFDYQIRARRFSADCQPLGDAFLVNNLDTGEEYTPAVAMDGAGNFLITWVGYDNHWNGVFARRFDPQGQPLGGQFRVNKPQRFNQFRPTVGLDSEGNAVVAYISEVAKTSDGFDYDVLVRRFDSHDVPVGDVFTPATETAGTQSLPQVAVTGPGDFAIMWAAPEEDGDLLIRGFDSTANPNGPEMVVSNNPSNQFLGGLTTDGSDRFLASWTTGVSLEASQIYGRYYTLGGPPNTGAAFTPTNDTFINLRRARSSYGAKPVMKVRDAATDFHTYVKFNVQDLAGPVQSATLRLYVTTGAGRWRRLRRVSSFYDETSDLWLEEHLTPRNAPPMRGCRWQASARCRGHGLKWT